MIPFKRLQELGFPTYRSYLLSAHWQDVRARYAKSKLPKRCVVCGDPRVQLHHRTYKRIGAEWLTDLVPLCDQHHEGTHKYLKETGKTVIHGRRYIKRERKRVQRKHR